MQPGCNNSVSVSAGMREVYYNNHKFILTVWLAGKNVHKINYIDNGYFSNDLCQELKFTGGLEMNNKLFK